MRKRSKRDRKKKNVLLEEGSVVEEGETCTFRWGRRGFFLEKQKGNPGAASVPLGPSGHPKLSDGRVAAGGGARLAAVDTSTATVAVGACTLSAPVRRAAGPTRRQTSEIQVVLEKIRPPRLSSVHHPCDRCLFEGERKKFGKNKVTFYDAVGLRMNRRSNFILDLFNIDFGNRFELSEGVLRGELMRWTRSIWIFLFFFFGTEIEFPKDRIDELYEL